jgi:adenine-specific DNA-methyltransferase
MNLTKKKKLGAFYTDNVLVNFLTEKILINNPNRILEPSFGDGIFIKNLYKRNYNNEIVGIEIDKKTFKEIKINNNKLKLINKNFLEYNENKGFDAIIGNPPFVRTRFLPSEQKKISVNYYKNILNLKSLSDPSIWLLFVYHSLNLLNKNASIGLILPYDFTFVNYAKPLWKKIFSNFGTVEIHHTKKRYFTDILQDTIIFYADKYGEQTNFLSYFTYQKDITDNNFFKKKITINDILNDNKPFKRALLPTEYFNIEKKIKKNLIKISDIAKFHIGYVSGNKKFFHPNDLTIKKFNLKRNSLIQTIADTKILKNIGIFTSNINKKQLSNLFYPKKINSYDLNYIKYGEDNLVNKQHKTLSRKKWFMVPLIKPPQYFINIFDEFPLMILNNANYIATNTFLCGYLNNDIEKKILLNNWYNSLTELFIEIEIHSLGGGMLVFVPNEISKIYIANNNIINDNFIKNIDFYSKTKNIKKIVELGNKFILKKYLKLTDKEINIIIKCVNILKFWRIPK